MICRYFSIIVVRWLLHAWVKLVKYATFLFSPLRTKIHIHFASTVAVSVALLMIIALIAFVWTD